MIPLKRIVFIPGIMGSSLFEGNIERWFRVKNKHLERLVMVKGKSKNPITPGLPIEYGVNMVGTLFSKNIIYAPIIDMLKNLEGSTVSAHLFGYDWRLNLWDVCPELHDFISLFDPNDEIIIIAHSMGGLLTHTYCQWASGRGVLPRIKQVITLGTPWKGSPDAFSCLMYGMDEGFFFPDKEVIRDIGRTFPSLYQLLPSRDYCLNGSFVSVGGRELTWKDYMDYIKTLQGCDVFDFDLINLNLHNSLKKPWPIGVEHHNIIGYNHGSVGTLTIIGPGEDLMTPTDGDGTVPILAAKPYNEDTSNIVYAHASHQGLTHHRAVLEWIQKLIGTGKASHVDGILGRYTPREDWVVQRIACPVEVFVEGEEETLNSSSQEITRHTIGEVTYLIHNDPHPKDIKVLVEPFDTGRTEIETLQFIQSKVELVNKFPSIKADPTQSTLVELTFNDKHPVTSVKVIDQMHKSHVIQGIDVVPDGTKALPETSMRIEAIGKHHQAHYDERGVVLSFKNKSKNEKAPKILETLIKVNDSELISHINQSTVLSIENGFLQYGRNVIEYYSKDIFNNIEKPKKRYIFVEPMTQEFITTLELHPDYGIKLSLSSKYVGIKYDFEYHFSNEDEIFTYRGPIKVPSGCKQVFIRAKNDFVNDSAWSSVDLELNELMEAVWDEAGYNEGIAGILSRLPQPESNALKVLIGKVEKGKNDEIPKLGKAVEVHYPKVTYIITLMPNLEVYLDYHTQIIRRDQDSTTLSFIIYDSDDNVVKDLKPSVKYTLLPAINPLNEVFYPAVTSNKKGVYSFTVPIKDISNEVNKIKFDFRDVHYRKKPLKSHVFRLQ
ncbi:lipase/acyltransferase domain-containing protein [Brevibacillus antibioticus]|nr:hypothetical protein [Brevibacillus antibioticus]